MTETFERRSMNFWEAVKAMDQGHIVRMVVNPEMYYKLASDGETFVSTRIIGKFYEGAREWHNAVFFTTHIVGDWCICDEEVVL